MHSRAGGRSANRHVLKVAMRSIQRSDSFSLSRLDRVIWQLQVLSASTEMVLASWDNIWNRNVSVSKVNIRHCPSRVSLDELTVNLVLGRSQCDSSTISALLENI